MSRCMQPLNTQYIRWVRIEKRVVDVVVPCFNESLNLPIFLDEYLNLCSSFDEVAFNLIIVDNGSTDETSTIAKNFVLGNVGSKCIILSRNFGKEASLSAGIEASSGDACIPIDADLQDPIKLIPEMVSVWQSGADVVLARRLSRKGEKVSRVIFSKAYLNIFNHLSETRIVPSVGEFRLMDRTVVNAFNSLPENQRFVRGLFAWLGFNEVIVDFERPARDQGSSKFSLGRLLNLGVDGVTSFTTLPLRFATIAGLIVASATSLLAVIILCLSILGRIDVPGYTSTIFVVLILGSIQLTFMGIMGEYIGKILLESKRRPLYIVKESLTNNGT